jgi:hypothetical protein
MTMTQEDMRQQAQRLEIDLRKLVIAVHRSGARGGLRIGMANKVGAYLDAAIFAAQQAKMGLSPFIGLTNADRAEADEASHR